MGSSKNSFSLAAAAGAATLVAAVWMYNQRSKKSCKSQDESATSCNSLGCVIETKAVEEHTEIDVKESSSNDDTKVSPAAADVNNTAPTSDSAPTEESPSTNPQSSSQRRENGAFPRDWLRQLLLSHAHNHPNLPQNLQDKALVVAPMVDASDLPYRLLTRRYNTNLCFTPMIHARMFIEKEGYRRKFWRFHGMPKEDRPLIAQFCGHDKEVLYQAMKVVEDHVDGVDINCGCPQNIAKKGQYGAYLMEKDGGDCVVEIVRYLAPRLKVPVSVKLRILPSDGESAEPRFEDSMDLYRRLVDAGASMLTIHGRTREQRQRKTGAADWEFTKRVVDEFKDRIPVLSNGSISNMDEVERCLEETGADGVMVSEAILEYPPLFMQTNVEATNYKRTCPGRLQMAEDYLELCKEYPPDAGGQGSGLKCIRAHLHRFLHADLQTHTIVRDAVVRSFSMEAADNAVKMVRDIHKEINHDPTREQLSWYVRHRMDWEEGFENKNPEPVPEKVFVEEKKVEEVEDDEDDGGCGFSPSDPFGESCGVEDGDY
ncbi:tRNA-dihydrouridine synthase [Skeletonema marinoi]|uniref:tRNA-dihydrouridine(16/17) synthase [NAD(P)(+)] n=1 Tax=Skeletonema marinoi TaxID=267567 RepID=A0AAD9DDM4_9STRA|nr:tRNA-dihydrouridine synthase [Skeletonema marinoi]